MARKQKPTSQLTNEKLKIAKKIIEAVKGFPKETQIKILKAAAILNDIEWPADV